VVKEAAALFRRRPLAPHCVWHSAGVETALFNDNFNGRALPAATDPTADGQP